MEEGGGESIHLSIGMRNCACQGYVYAKKRQLLKIILHYFSFFVFGQKDPNQMYVLYGRYEVFLRVILIRQASQKAIWD